MPHVSFIINDGLGKLIRPNPLRYYFESP